MIPECPHCSRMIMRSDVLRAVYSALDEHLVIGMYAKTRGVHHYLHRDCFDDLAGLSYLYDPVQDTFTVSDPQIAMGERRRPNVCACCASPIVKGDALWALTYGELSVSPKRGVVFRDNGPDPCDGPYPDTYICSACADTYVFGEG